MISISKSLGIFETDNHRCRCDCFICIGIPKIFIYIYNFKGEFFLFEGKPIFFSIQYYYFVYNKN